MPIVRPRPLITPMNSLNIKTGSRNCQLRHIPTLQNSRTEGFCSQTRPYVRHEIRIGYEAMSGAAFLRRHDGPKGVLADIAGYAGLSVRERRRPT